MRRPTVLAVSCGWNGMRIAAIAAALLAATPVWSEDKPEETCDYANYSDYSELSFPLGSLVLVKARLCGDTRYSYLEKKMIALGGWREWRCKDILSLGKVDDHNLILKSLGKTGLAEITGQKRKIVAIYLEEGLSHLFGWDLTEKGYVNYSLKIYPDQSVYYSSYKNAPIDEETKTRTSQSQQLLGTCALVKGGD
ncbi:hypothetical protein [Nitratireductor sp. XY-223]|uniref:hypothetical protein n=1 Tax=Nitratireductor sp. XY-223 TaxID=2561926 RepID=UPI0010AB029E|nr:hypothetical protein [Nitratireductor sp. XY-223]